MQPSYCTVLALRKINLTQQSHTKWLMWAEVGFWLAISLISVFTINYEYYFATEFEKNSGVTWLLYSHVNIPNSAIPTLSPSL
jgi:hypothetical protein